MKQITIGTETYMGKAIIKELESEYLQKHPIRTLKKLFEIVFANPKIFETYLSTSDYVLGHDRTIRVKEIFENLKAKSKIKNSPEIEKLDDLLEYYETYNFCHANRMFPTFYGNIHFIRKFISKESNSFNILYLTDLIEKLQSSGREDAYEIADKLIKHRDECEKRLSRNSEPLGSDAKYYYFRPKSNTNTKKPMADIQLSYFTFKNEQYNLRKQYMKEFTKSIYRISGERKSKTIITEVKDLGIFNFTIKNYNTMKGYIINDIHLIKEDVDLTKEIISILERHRVF